MPGSAGVTATDSEEREEQDKQILPADNDKFNTKLVKKKKSDREILLLIQEEESTVTSMEATREKGFLNP
jgi:hypothetical protein